MLVCQNSLTIHKIQRIETQYRMVEEEWILTFLFVIEWKRSFYMDHLQDCDVVRACIKHERYC